MTRQDLSASAPVTATLGYAGSYTVTGRGGGTLTWLPSAGQVIGQGQALYRVDNGSPVVLLYGSVPDWRPMSAGDTGADVSQLNHDLVRLGYANSADVSALGWDYYSWETRYGVRQMEEHLGVSSPPGSLGLGQVVFEPGALRISQVTGSLGGQAGGTVLDATSTRHVVTISLDASQQTQVKAGDKVTITLPDGTTTPGVVLRWQSGQRLERSGQQRDRPGLRQAAAAGGRRDAGPGAGDGRDHHGSAKNALVVPVGALLALARTGATPSRSSAAGGAQQLVPVSLGLFDDAERTGADRAVRRLTAGQHVVVPAS